MKRLLRETFVLIGAPVAIALAVLMVGTAIAETPTETDPPESWPVSECHTTTVVGLAGSGVGGSALFCTADDAVRPAAYLAGLTPGGTYGVWLLASDRSTECRSTHCSMGSVFDAGYPGAFGRVGEVPAGVHGTAHARGHVNGWTMGSGATVTLLVTNEGTGSAGPDGASVFGLFRPGASRVGPPSTIGLSGGEVASVVAVAVFRLTS